MNLQSIPIDQINPAPYNPRQDLKPGDPEYEKLFRSIDTFGCVEPPVWNQRTGHLVGGHQRFKILKARGDVAVDVVVVDLPMGQEKSLNIALNKIDGSWDQDKLATLLSDLVAMPDLDVSVTGFDGVEVEHLIADLALDLGWEDCDETDESESDGDPITQPGDLIVLGANQEHRLLCGDVTKPSDVHRLFETHRASMCHTDPPYGVRYDPKNRPISGNSLKQTDAKKSTKKNVPQAKALIQNDDLTPKQYAKWFPQVVTAINEAIVPGGAFYIWNAHRYFGLMHDLLRANSLKVASTIVWAKESFSPGFGDYNEQVEFCLYGYKGGARHKWYGPKNASTLWNVHRDRTRDYRHPTQKPLELAERAIRNSSKRGEIVFDPFLGSGTTLLAAAHLGRRCFGLEIDPRHCDRIVRRYMAMAGIDAVEPEIAKRYRIEKEAA
ncbi:MAG: DNA modification methylase [Pseudomonadota bacterium]